MNDYIKKQLCIDDFYLMLSNAMIAAGGNDNTKQWKAHSLEEFVEIFAQNGIRAVYMPEKHMDAIEIIWKDPRNNNIPLTPPNQPYSPPKKKQLLCDSMDKGESDCEFDGDDVGR